MIPAYPLDRMAVVGEQLRVGGQAVARSSRTTNRLALRLAPADRSSSAHATRFDRRRRRSDDATIATVTTLRVGRGRVHCRRGASLRRTRGHSARASATSGGSARPAAVRDVVRTSRPAGRTCPSRAARAPRTSSTTAGTRSRRGRRAAAARRGTAAAPRVRDRRRVRPRPPRVRAPRDPRRRAACASAVAAPRRAPAPAATRRTIHATDEADEREADREPHEPGHDVDRRRRSSAPTGSSRSPSHRSGPRNGRGAGSLRNRRSPRMSRDVGARGVGIDGLPSGGSRRASRRPRARRRAGRSSSARRTPRRGCADRSRARRSRRRRERHRDHRRDRVARPTARSRRRVGCRSTG